MPNQVRRFSYKRWNWFDLFLLLMTVVTILALGCNIITFIYSPENQENASTGTVITSTIAMLVFLFVIMSAYAIAFPDVLVRDSSFRIRKRFYRTRWIDWAQIQCVNNPLPNLDAYERRKVL